MWLAAAEKVLWPIICRLSGNNRPITDYLKNGRLIGFADYLPINRLIPSVSVGSANNMNRLSLVGMQLPWKNMENFNVSSEAFHRAFAWNNEILLIFLFHILCLVRLVSINILHDICRDLKIKKLQKEIDDLKAMLAEERILNRSQFQQVVYLPCFHDDNGTISVVFPHWFISFIVCWKYENWCWSYDTGT